MKERAHEDKSAEGHVSPNMALVVTKGISSKALENVTLMSAVTLTWIVLIFHGLCGPIRRATGFQSTSPNFPSLFWRLPRAQEQGQSDSLVPLPRSQIRRCPTNDTLTGTYCSFSLQVLFF